MKKLLPAIFSLLLIIAFIIYLFATSHKEEAPIERSSVYIASDSLEAMVYREEDSMLYEYVTLVRGTPVISRNIEVEINDGEAVFTQIELEEITEEGEAPTIFYIDSSNLTGSLDNVVMETAKYVRTPVTVYENSHDARISGFLKKGTELSICGYEGLREDGSVEMYRIDNSGNEGYVYAKYLANTQEEADAVYSQIADIHAGREYSFELYGGMPDSLDWYPFPKPELSEGPLLENARAMYITAYAAAPDSIDTYIDLALSSGANAMVVDIKDGALAYESEVAKELSPTSYQYSFLTVDQYRSSIQKIKNAGLYVIGRIVAFNDNLYAADHPEECIDSDVEAFLWPSAYSRECWYYNVALAEEAVEEFGFDEIQFDYVRFPESAYYMSDTGMTDFKNTYGEEKGEAIQNFCFYAADRLHKNGAYLSIDVFGECVGAYVTAYGQYWPAISNVVDAISGMPYTDHFGDTDTWTYPYTTIYEWAGVAAVRQSEIRTPAVARTWITGYNTPYWDGSVIYGNKELIDQAQALYDAGLTGGFIPWNALSDLDKYYEYSGVWANQY